MARDRRDAIGLIGVGLVGMAIAERLLAAGLAVVGYDINRARVEALVASGGLPATDARDVAGRARRVIIALLDSSTTALVIDAIVSVMSAGDVVIDVGTGDPRLAGPFAARLTERGVEWVDAPLSGSSEQIRRGEAVAMLGGTRVAVAACDDIWPVIAKTHVHLGPAGSGQRAKLATNLILGLNRVALAEGLAFAEACGLDAEAFVDLVRITPAYSRAVDAKAERMLERNYEPESRIAQHRKDVRLMLDAANTAGIELQLTAAHAALLDDAIAAGDGELDNAAIVEVYRRSRTRK